jgi:bacterial/archaeal transporter family protein
MVALRFSAIRSCSVKGIDTRRVLVLRARSITRRRGEEVRRLFLSSVFEWESDLRMKKRSLPRWFAYSVLSFCWWGVFGFLSKIGSARLPPEQMLMLFTLGMLPPVLAAYFYDGVGIETDRLGAICGVLTGLLGGLGELAYFEALRLGKAAVVGPMTSLFPLLTVLLAVLFLKERIGVVQATGVILALVSIFVLSI